MTGITGVKIRNYQEVDRKSVRKISLDSSILGEYRKTVFDDEILADLLTAYFIDFEPFSCFVAEKEGAVIGYVLGTRDICRMRRVMKCSILPQLIKKAFLKGHVLQRNNIELMKSMLSGYIKGEFKVPDFAREYPATLHVNVIAQSRGQNVGSLLVNHFLDFLKREGVAGIHFGVMSESAKRFFIKLNFEILFNGKYTFLHYLTGEILPHYILGKKL